MPEPAHPGQRLFLASEADKPTVLLIIDSEELKDPILKNLVTLGIGNLEHASIIFRSTNC